MNMFKSSNLVVKIILLIFIGILSGCATTQSTQGTTEYDPLESTNRSFYNFNETLDRHLLKPIAEGYANVTPKPLRTGITNFFDNLSYLNVILNSFLQGKLGQGFSDTARFLVNSTVGLGGMFDVATDMGFPVHEEDLGQTLAVWGFQQGAYLYIPVVKGPNTVRDVPDMASSTLTNPLTYVSSAILWPVSALNIINTRANLLDDTNIRDEAAVDPYSFTREAYIQRREFLIHDGNLPTEGYDDIFEEEPGDDPSLKIE